MTASCFVNLQETEKHLAEMVVSKALIAKVDRPAGVVCFQNQKDSNEVLNSWAVNIEKLLELVEKSCHQIHKETMVHKVTLKVQWWTLMKGIIGIQRLVIFVLIRSLESLVFSFSKELNFCLSDTFVTREQRLVLAINCSYCPHRGSESLMKRYLHYHEAFCKWWDSNCTRWRITTTMNCVLQDEAFTLL